MDPHHPRNALQSSVDAGVGDDDYESLPGRYPVIIHMGAGAVAGLAEHCTMYPVDCVKTRMQSLSYGATYGSNTFAALGRIVREEGVFRPVRGISAMATGALPAHAAYFACYEKLKEVLTVRIGHGPVAHGLAGTAAALMHDAVMNPAEVVKQRMQMYKSPYSSCWHCVSSVVQNEGVRAFYRSYFTQLAMNVPFQSIHFMIYELSQDYMNPSRTYSAAKHSLCGAIAGAVAAAVTTPLDVCKTVLNTQEGCIYNSNNSSKQSATPVRGLVNAFKTVYKCCGFRGYFQGMQARVIYQIPSTALSWLVYESIKYTLKQHYPSGGGGIGGSNHAAAVLPTTSSVATAAALLGQQQQHAPLFYAGTLTSSAHVSDVPRQ